MSYELTLLSKKWLEHPTHGVLAKLATVPRDMMGGGTWPVPDQPTIYSDMDADMLAAQDIDPPVVPALVLYVEDDMVEERESPAVRTGTIRFEAARLTIVYIHRDENLLKCARDSSFVLRAVRKSLRAFNSQQLSAGFREYNGIGLHQIGPMVTVRTAGAVGRSTIWGFVEAKLKFTDQDP